MKKILLLLIPTVLILIYSSIGLLVLSPEREGEYTLYTDGIQRENDLSYTECLLKSMTTDEKGITLRIKEGIGYENIVRNLKAEEKFVEKTSDSILIYYYTPYLKNYVKLKDYRINLQICINNEYTVVGTPLVYGST